MKKKENQEITTFAGGCFWCTEAIFRRLKGVVEVTSGYSGGKTENPSYEQVSSGVTGHAEVVQIKFNPMEITYLKLIEVFFKIHDPTSLNRQAADVGTQYRSAIFYHNQEQKNTALEFIKTLEGSEEFNQKIVTELVPYSTFYPAEKYHKDYYEKNRGAVYCKLVIDPKIQKLYKDFRGIVKII